MLFMLCLLAMITYLDRAMYGSAKGDMMAAVGRPVEDFFWVLVAFQLAYALFEVPTGWLGDRFGPRATLIRHLVSMRTRSDGRRPRKLPRFRQDFPSSATVDSRARGLEHLD